MSDYISRQEAIDAICKACSMEGDYHLCDGYAETSTWCDSLTAVRRLPAVELPIQCVANELKDIIKKWKKDYQDSKEIQKLISKWQRKNNIKVNDAISLKRISFPGKKTQEEMIKMYGKDYIDRESAIVRATEACKDDETAYEVKEALKDILSADVRKHTRGVWIPHNERSREYIGSTLIAVHYDYWCCNVCGYKVERFRPAYSFCPHCGADMRDGGR